MKIFEHELYEISLEEDIQATCLRFKDFCNTEFFKEAHLKLLEAFLEHRTGKHLTDVRQMGAVHPDVQIWVANTIVMEMAQASPLAKVYIALILGEDIFANFAAENIAERTTKISCTRFFNDLEKGKFWLKQIVL